MNKLDQSNSVIGSLIKPPLIYSAQKTLQHISELRHTP